MNKSLLIENNNNFQGISVDGYYINNYISFNEESQLLELFEKRSNMCGIGTKRLKNFLNRKVKEGDKVAEILCLALKLEDERISSRIYSDKYRKRAFNKVERYLRKFIEVLEDSSICEYGYITAPYYDYNIYQHDKFVTLCIDLPGNHQIGFVIPTYLKIGEHYKKKVKQSKKTVLTKIEEVITSIYGEQITQKYGESAYDTNVKLPNVYFWEKDDIVLVIKPKLYRYVTTCDNVTSYDRDYINKELTKLIYRDYFYNKDRN